MNDIPNTELVEREALPADQFVEILDAAGNPTGVFTAREGEATSEETAFIATDDAVREVTVH